MNVERYKEGRDKLVKVPLARSKLPAILFEKDFEDLMALGVSIRWRLYHNQVVVRCNGKDIAVGRLIRHAEPFQRVEIRDGNPLNLRRNNLMLASGTSRYAAREMVQHVNQQ
jgi:hypothetical protein